MRKILLFALVTFTTLSAFAEYVLTPDDQKIVDAFVQKIQARPINARDRIIDGLQKAQVKTTDEKNLAILKSVESQVRLKTPQGDVIATKNERKELLKVIFKNSNDNNGIDKAIMAKVNTSGSFTTSDNERISFSGTIDEAVDMSDISNPKISFKIDFSGSDNDRSMSGAGEARLLDKIGYFKLSQLVSNDPDISMQIDQIKQYMGIWWKTPYQADSDITQLSSDLSQEEKQKIIELISQNNFIPKLLIAKNPQGTTYSGVVVNREIIKLINTISAENGHTMSASEKKDLIDGLSHITFFVSMGLDNNSQFRTWKIIVTLKNLSDDTGTVVNGSFSLDFSFSPLTSPIVAPEGARDIETAL